MSVNAVFSLVIRGHTPLYPETIHAFLVAHKDDEWRSGRRPTYALTLCKIFQTVHVCHMASTCDDLNRIRSTGLHGSWLISCHCDDTFIFRMTYRYCCDSLAQTRSVTVDLTYRHADSPNIYVNNHANMLWLDLLYADDEDHVVFNVLIDADKDYLPDIKFNFQMYNRLITANPDTDWVTVISDSDAEDIDAENEGEVTDGAPFGSNQSHIFDV